MQIIFKICPAAEWAAAEAAGAFTGSAVDLADGFIHLSTAAQVRETARRHFAGKNGLMLIAFAAEDLENLKWEPSRGGALFPHVYGSISTSLARWAKPLPFIAGIHVFPEGAAS